MKLICLCRRTEMHRGRNQLLIMKNELNRVMVGDVGDAVVAVEGAERTEGKTTLEEVVDATGSTLAESIVGIGSIGDRGKDAAVLQLDAMEGVEDGVVVGGVHVATDKDGHVGCGPLVGQTGQQFGGFGTCHTTHVVEMGVHIKHLALGRLVLEDNHGDGAMAACIPPHADAVGRLAEPVGSTFDQLESVFFEEDGHVFALALAIFATNAVTLVVGQSAVEISQLVG